MKKKIILLIEENQNIPCILMTKSIIYRNLKVRGCSNYALAPTTKQTSNPTISGLHIFVSIRKTTYVNVESTEMHFHHISVNSWISVSKLFFVKFNL